jgi:hypothetical protein
LDAQQSTRKGDLENANKDAFFFLVGSNFFIGFTFLKLSFSLLYIKIFIFFSFNSFFQNKNIQKNYNSNIIILKMM